MSNYSNYLTEALSNAYNEPLNESLSDKKLQQVENLFKAKWKNYLTVMNAKDFRDAARIYPQDIYQFFDKFRDAFDDYDNALEIIEDLEDTYETDSEEFYRSYKTLALTVI